MTKAAKILFCLFILNVAAASAATDDPGIDKSEFNLLNPTPSDHLREMTLDGPGSTESPYTVDAGHFQIEMGLASYSSSKQRFDGSIYRFDSWMVGPVNLKVGLLNRLDIQLMFEPYTSIYERGDSGSFSSRRSGFGDTTLRFKYNLWGNDSGRTALALTPFVRFPTARHDVGSDGFEGGVVVPFAAELPSDFYLGLTSRFVWARDILTSGHHAQFSGSVELSHQLIGDLEGYVEFFSEVSAERGVGWVGKFNSGLVYSLTDNLQLNAGVEIGLTEWADDWSVFAGMAWRY